MLIDVYRAVMQCARMRRIKVHSYGDESAFDAIGANPRMIWIPTRDIYTAPQCGVRREEMFIEGQRALVESRMLRHAQCNVHIFTDFGPDGYVAMESLINDFMNALYEECEVQGGGGNYKVLEALWGVRDHEEVRSIEVVQALSFAVPIWNAVPAQVVGGVVVG